MFKIRFKKMNFFFISYLILLIQSVLLSNIFHGYSKPDLILLLVIFYALYHGPKQGMIIGMIFGFCVDVLSGGIFGANIFVLGLLGYLSGFLMERVYRDHFLTMIMIPFFASIISAGVYSLVTGDFYQTPLLSQQIVSVVYTTGISFFFLNFLKNQVIMRTYTVQRI